MALIHGLMGKFPWPICLVPHDELIRHLIFILFVHHISSTSSSWVSTEINEHNNRISKKDLVIRLLVMVDMLMMLNFILELVDFLTRNEIWTAEFAVILLSCASNLLAWVVAVTGNQDLQLEDLFAVDLKAQFSNHSMWYNTAYLIGAAWTHVLQPPVHLIIPKCIINLWLNVLENREICIKCYWELFSKACAIIGLDISISNIKMKWGYILCEYRIKLMWMPVY